MQNTKDPGVNYVPPWLLPLAVWGWNNPLGHLHHHQGHWMQPLHPSTPTYFNSCTFLIPSFFYLSITFPFTPLLFFHSFFFHPRLFHFTPSQASLNIPLPTIIKHLTRSKTAPPLHSPSSPLLPPPLAFAQSSLQPGYVCLSSGSGGPVTPRPSRWPPLSSDLCV